MPLVISPRAADINGLPVRRVLPTRQRRTVGPFCFLDEMGPAVFAAGEGIDVRPPPHIGLSTLTYLLDGELVHRDSLGCTQAIRPGDVNWMTARHGLYSMLKIRSATPPASSRIKLAAPPARNW